MTDQLFAHGLVLHRFLSIHNAIFEVKYEKHLFPDIQAIIGSLDKVGESPSKYETCVIYYKTIIIINLISH